MNIIDSPSPNFDDRPEGQVVDMVIIHAMALPLDKALEILQKPCPEGKYEVSAHYLIDHDGTIYRLVNEDKRAFHAGISEWGGRKNLNYCSIGIELLNKDVNGGEAFNRPFEEKQIEALHALLDDIKTRHPIRNEYILGHDQIAPTRKNDPGPHFPWHKFRKNAIS